MKTYVTYGVAAVLTLALSTYLTYFAASSGAADDMSTLEEGRIAAEQIERATEQAFKDFQAERLMAAGDDQLAVVRPLKDDLRDLGDRLKATNARVDAILNGDLQAKAAEGGVEVPENARLDELVSQAIVKFRDDETKKRDAERKKQREERAQRRRDEMMKTLTEKLNLDAGQTEQVTALMTEMEQMGNDMREKMRAARRDGGDTDWRSMMEDFRKVGEDADAKMKEILNPDQQQSYQTYKDENPMSAMMFGGGMRGFGNRGGGNNRGRRGGNR